MQIKIGPKTWPSAKAAAADIGCSTNTLWSYINRGEEEKLLAWEPGKKTRAKPITLDGVRYPSIKAAEAALKRDPRRLKKEAAGHVIGPTAGIPLFFLGREFTSLGDLAFALGYQRRTLYRPHQNGSLSRTLARLETLYRAMKRIEQG